MSEEIIVQDREELIYLLCEAAEFEHSVMCSYLYAQWTLKRGTDEDVSTAELEAIGRWRRSLAQVALEEMLHLSLVNNLLAAVGAAPHLWRPAFPVRPGHFPADVEMNLAPFGEAALEHFMFIERPEGIRIADGAGFNHAGHYRRLARPDMLAPSPQDYATQGHLYHGVLQGLARLAEQLGEERVFVGHGQAQVGVEEFGLPGLFKVTDLASARRAIEEIVLQGEGAPAHREDSHFARFSAIREELGRLRAARPAFEPARPVVRNPTLDSLGIARDRIRITEPVTARVIDLANSVYALMIRTLSQVFAPAPLPRELRLALATATTTQMSIMGRIAATATRLPAGPQLPGLTAAPNFELPGSSGQLVQQCAARILGERAAELAAAARRMAAGALADVADDLDRLARRFEDLHGRFETGLGEAVDRVARLQVPAAAPPAAAELPGAKAGDYVPDVARGRLPRQHAGRVAAPGNDDGRALRGRRARLPVRRDHLRAPRRRPAGGGPARKRGAGARERSLRRPRAHRAVGCGGAARDVLPLRAVAAQALLRRQPRGRGLRRHRRAGHGPLRAARRARRDAAGRPPPERPAAAQRQRRDLQRHRTDGAADAVDAAVPLRRLGEQAVLRRLARARRLSLRGLIPARPRARPSQYRGALQASARGVVAAGCRTRASRA